MTVEFKNGIGSRERVRELLVAHPTRPVQYLFDYNRGRIPLIGVKSEKIIKTEKNGKWSYAIFEIALDEGFMASKIYEDFESGKFVPHVGRLSDIRNSLGLDESFFSDQRVEEILKDVFPKSFDRYVQKQQEISNFKENFKNFKELEINQPDNYSLKHLLVLDGKLEVFDHQTPSPNRIILKQHHIMDGIHSRYMIDLLVPAETTVHRVKFSDAQRFDSVEQIVRDLGIFARDFSDDAFLSFMELHMPKHYAKYQEVQALKGQTDGWVEIELQHRRISVKKGRTVFHIHDGSVEFIWDRNPIPGVIEVISTKHYSGQGGGSTHLNVRLNPICSFGQSSDGSQPMNLSWSHGPKAGEVAEVADSYEKIEAAANPAEKIGDNPFAALSALKKK